jgi:UDP-hydrolysing UDP-N-acetyl-D-glucosamine 2-epimerase
LSKGKRKVCAILVDRANYGRLKPVLRAIDRHPALELQVVVAGTMVLERFDQPIQVVRRDGFPIAAEVYLELEGSTPATMAKSVGFGVVEFAGELQRLKPDVVLIIGDRYESLSAALAAAFMNICIVHMQGGEVSGSIDESTRHAISKFAHFHFPATKRSADYLLRMGEWPRTILGVGCPSSDIARELDRAQDLSGLNQRGRGRGIDFSRPFLLTVFHPTTTQYGNERDEMLAVMEALRRQQMQTLLLWPNIDAGADHISKAIRQFRDRVTEMPLHTLTNLTPEQYLKVLASTACAIGNSSSFVRDASYFGTPVVLVGSRQDGRETDQHVSRVPAETEAIAEAIKRQLEQGRYPPSALYGDGQVSERVAQALAELDPYVQKRLRYAFE